MLYIIYKYFNFFSHRKEFRFSIQLLILNFIINLGKTMINNNVINNMINDNNLYLYLQKKKQRLKA